MVLVLKCNDKPHSVRAYSIPIVNLYSCQIGT